MDAQIDPAKPNYDSVLAGKSAWLDTNFFFVRAAIYFAIWIGLASYFRGQSIKQDESGDPAISLRLARVAAPGLLLFALSTTFAAFDWIMSLDPHWFSTIFGITYFSGGVMAFFAFTILLTRWLGSKGYLTGAMTTEHFHDLGKFLFAFMVFWTYTNFSQYMLIWYANLPEETVWYAHRQHGGWAIVGTLLIVGHFLFPFAFLMSRHVKRHPLGLAFGAIFLLVIHCIDMQYLILPNMDHGDHAAPAGEAAHGGFAHEFGAYLHTISWADFGCYVGLLALLGGFVLMNVRRTNLVPVRDPRLAESLKFQNIRPEAHTHGSRPPTRRPRSGRDPRGRRARPRERDRRPLGDHLGRRRRDRDVPLPLADGADLHARPRRGTHEQGRARAQHGTRRDGEGRERLPERREPEQEEHPGRRRRPAQVT